MSRMSWLISEDETRHRFARSCGGVRTISATVFKFPDGYQSVKGRFAESAADLCAKEPFERSSNPAEKITESYPFHYSYDQLRIYLTE